MSEVGRNLTAFTRDMLKWSLDKSIESGRQISTWLVVGNAGAMVVSFNAVIQGQVCNAAPIHAAASYFACGLGLAFGGSVASYAGGIANSLYFARVNNAAEVVYVSDVLAHEAGAEADKEPTVENYREAADAWNKAAENSKVLAAIKPPSRWIWATVAASLVLYCASAAAFGAGILGPMTHNPRQFARCTAETPGTPPREPVSRPTRDRGEIIEKRDGK